MAKATCALTNAALTVRSLSSPSSSVCIRRDVEYNVVRVACIGNSLNPLKLIKPESVPGPPRDHVIGARSVATDTQAAHSLSGLVECQTAAEYVHTTDTLADHWVNVRTERLAVDGRKKWSIARLGRLSHPLVPALATETARNVADGSVATAITPTPHT